MFKRNIDHVKTNFNPYLATDPEVSVGIKVLEDITVEHSKLQSPRLLKDILQDQLMRTRTKKRICKDVLRLWEIEYKRAEGLNKTEVLETTATIKNRKIKQTSTLTLFAYILLSIVAILIAAKTPSLTEIPGFGKYIGQFYQTMSDSLINLLVILLAYTSLFTVLYILVVKTYFKETKSLGTMAEKYLNAKFSKLNHAFKKQHKALKRHLLGNIKRKKIQTYRIKYIYSPSTFIEKVKQYHAYIDERFTHFSKLYYLLLFFSLVLRLGMIGMVAYIAYRLVI